jgi:hypothetical protein
MAKNKKATPGVDKELAYIKGGRVALGGCPPRAPTDPYGRVERIRLVSAWVRYRTYTECTTTGVGNG